MIVAFCVSMRSKDPNLQVGCVIVDSKTLKVSNLSYRTRWRLYILPQFLANLTQPIGAPAWKATVFFANFFPELTALCMQGLKFSDLFCAFLRAVLGFSCHLFPYGGLKAIILYNCGHTYVSTLANF